MLAISSGWRFMGKRNSRFNFELKPGKARPAQPSNIDEILVDNFAIITLQTDALMFNAYDSNLEDFENIRGLYEDYWDVVTEKSCKMKHFFARQKMLGRYYGKRYPFHADGNYYPYILTSAGSVFVLEAVNETKAPNVLSELQEKGLPLPVSIRRKLTKNKAPEERFWQACPFVPENGFGEIVINLKWHWQKRFINKEENANG